MLFGGLQKNSLIDYPGKVASRQILALARSETLGALEQDETAAVEQVMQSQLFNARRKVMALHLGSAVEEYIVELVETTRNPAPYSKEISSWIRWGASPRGAIALERAARATAWLAGRDFVTPEDVQKVAPDGLRHRMLLDYEAEADGITPQRCIEEILTRVPSP